LCAPLLLLGSFGGSIAQGPDFHEAVVANRVLIDSLRVRCAIPGLSVSVFHDGRIAWSESFGYADLESLDPATPASRFRIASLSKVLTGTAVAKLREQGVLDLDAPIGRYLNEIPEAWRSITTRQLASHTSGIGHYLSVEDALDATHYPTTAAALEKFKDRPLVHPPGTKEHYSSYAYSVIAAVIESVSGMDYRTFMDRSIFEPLAMMDTTADVPHDIILRRTAFYDFDEERRVRNAPYVDLSGRWAGSGFLSTADDIARFGAAHTEPGFLNTETLDLLGEPQPVGNEKTNDGLGWGARRGWEGRRMYWGNGRTPGATCGLLVYRDAGLSVAVLSNVRGAPIERGELEAIAQRFLLAAEGSPATGVSASAFGSYELTMKSGPQSFPGRLDLEATPDGVSGMLDVAGEQTLRVVDAFVGGGSTWVLCVGEGKPPISVGVLPLRLTFGPGSVTGEMLRTGISVSGTRR
jgi:CubicO group peptidase (beta-lactamase class C family)